MKLTKKIKKGAVAKVFSGKDKGKTGKVVSINKEKQRVVLQGINMFKKHKRPTKQGEKGEIVEVSRSIHMSNISIE